MTIWRSSPAQWLIASVAWIRVEAMRGGQFVDTGEYQRLSADRTLVHDELLQLTGMTRRDDMYHYCREVLANRAPDV